MAKCQMCDGLGAMGAPPSECLYCKGSGHTFRAAFPQLSRATCWIAVMIVLGGLFSSRGYAAPTRLAAGKLILLLADPDLIPWPIVCGIMFAAVVMLISAVIKRRK